MNRRTRESAAVASAALVLALVLPAVTRAETISVRQPLFFATSGQSLWGPRGGERTKPFRAVVLDEGEIGSKGQIRHIDVELDNSRAVQIWEEAVRRCDSAEYCHDFGFPIGRRCISPTRSQCINGVTLSILGVTIKRINGIGARPAGAITRPFDVGAEVAWDFHILWGVGGGVTVDEGTVNVEYPTEAILEVLEGDVQPGEVFTLRTSEIAGDVRLESEFPYVDAFIDTFLDAAAKLEMRAAYPNFDDGSQVEERLRIFNQDTDGEDHQELIGARIGTDGLRLRLLGEDFIVIDEGVEYSYSIPIVEGGAIGVGLPLLDVGLYFPELDTPVAPGFDGLGINGSFDGQRITNFVSAGERPLFNWGRLENGIQDADFGRFDLDLDVLTAAAWATPLGIEAKLGNFPVVGPLLSVEGNVLDVDSANFFGIRKEISFEPRLVVELNFSQPTTVETFPGSGKFHEVLSKTIPCGVDLKVVHPGGELAVEPIYSLAENVFTNDTDLVLDPAIEGKVFALKLEGMVADAAGLAGEFAAVQITKSLTSDLVKLVDLNFLDDEDEAQFTLGGFEDIGGSPIVVRAGGTFTRGDTNGDGGTDISDASFLLNWLFLGGGEPSCKAAANPNGDGAVDVSDASYLLNFLFLGGPQPVAPYPGCSAGTLESDSTIGCDQPRACR